MITNYAQLSVLMKNEFTHPNSHVLAEVTVALMVWCTIEYPWLTPWRHLHVIKYMTYKKIIWSLLHLRKSQY